MADDDYPGFIELLTQAFDTKFGGWQQPDLLHPCRGQLTGCPVIWTPAYELRELTIVWERAIGFTPAQDAGMCTFHFLNLTSGNPDATWTTGDYTTVENAAKTFWLAIKSGYSSHIRDLEFRWRADGPAFRPHGTSLQPTLRTVPASLTAGATALQDLPPQCAITVTEVTAAKYTVEDVEGVGAQQRNRWGRFYLPAPDTGQDSTGRVLPAFCDTIANAVKAWYNTCVAADIIPVMYSPTTGNAWSILEVHVDDIFDVVRSRRYVTPLSRHVQTINQPA